jgi:parvulin-like peptidyl-prolyl isomerase
LAGGAILFQAGCPSRQGPAVQSVSTAWESPQPAQQPGKPGQEPVAAQPTTPPEQQVIATVNGQAITREQFLHVLVASHGLAVLQQMMALELARQETTKRGITVTPQDVEAEYRWRLGRLYPVDPAKPTQLSQQEQDRALQLILQREGVSREEFMLKIERDAHVRKLAELELVIDEPTLREEYRLLYGPKVQGRLIVCRSLRQAEQARDLLVAGQDFASVARQCGDAAYGAQEGGLTRPFSVNDPSVPAALAAAAKQLQPGQISTTIRLDANAPEYAILQLEQTFPASDVPFEHVRDQVVQAYRQRILPERMVAITGRLISQARVAIVDPELRRQYQQQRAQSGGQAPALQNP